MEYELQLVRLNRLDFANACRADHDDATDGKESATVWWALRENVDRAGDRAKERQAQSVTVAVIGTRIKGGPDRKARCRALSIVDRFKAILAEAWISARQKAGRIRRSGVRFSATVVLR